VGLEQPGTIALLKESAVIGHTAPARKNLFAKEIEKMPNTTALPKEERKAAKRAARKKAAPKAARTHERGSAKQKVKKAARGTSKR
jgi:hypothetical protein